VIIATKGRPAELAASIRAVAAAGARLDDVWVSAVDPADTTQVPEGVNLIFGPAGAATQRNRAISKLPPVDVVYFFDDDMLIHPTYFEQSEALFEENTAVAGVTGRVLYDGAASGAIGIDAGERTLVQAEPPTDQDSSTVRNLYGCNFAVRSELLQIERFDDDLPLYSWLEDLDLSRRLLKHGELRRASAALCVHLGSPSGGRQSHLRFGYSQIANPLFLFKKRSLGFGDLLRLIGRPLLA
jgi:GT2 family glycosyltransferase